MPSQLSLSPTRMRPLARTMASRRTASTSSTGFFIRNRLLAAGNKAVTLVGTALAGSSGSSSSDQDHDEEKPNPYTEERCMVFPGFAHVQQDKLTVSIEGFAFRLRPLGSASRTQRLFVSAAKQLTSLPRLPKAPSQESLDLDIQVSPEELRQQAREHQERMKHEQLADGVPEHEHSLREAQAQSSSLRTPAPRRSDTMSSIASTASTATSSSTFAVSYSSAPLQVLHDNLHARLRLFFSQKLVGRRIRISIYLVPASLDTSPDSAEVCIAKGTLITESGGVFKSSITVPWNGEDPHRRQLRVRAELLSEVEDETIDNEAALKAVMARSDEASVGLSHARTKIRVISDIDDTIKLTHVLAGIKSVVRNVFTRPHTELVVPGMQEWYWTLYERGVSFHYLSNSPYEIFGVLRDYLKTTGFPPGSIRLKEYGGGSSLLGGLWESAASRKRGGAEEILKTFPESRFLLVGDSGEQDLELYTSLARQFPQQVLAIFIRDVTTPMPRIFANPSAAASVDSLHKPQPAVPGSSANTTKPGRLVRRRSDLEQEKLLESIVKEEQAAPIFSSETLVGTEPRDELDDADEFSPNNPLDRNLPSSGVLSPYDSEGYTEVERKVVSLFRDRVHRAKTQLPKDVTLTIFRDGDTCIDESLQMAGLSEKPTS